MFALCYVVWCCDVVVRKAHDCGQNFAMLSEYMTPMGRIMHSNDTGLRSKNQRRIAKAIRRAVGMGFMPSVHRHPEILMKESTRRNEPLSRETKA